MRFVAILFILQCFVALGVDKAPRLLKACINFDNQEVTLRWDKVSDACASFTKYQIYGNVDAGPFQLIDEVFDRSIETYTVGLPDLNPKRCYYLRVHSLCDHLDSAQSLTVCVDQSFPSLTNIDSVSVDVNTQDVIVGWTTNMTPDTRGYQIYNYTGLVGDSIGYTTSTSYNVGPYANNRYPVVLATNDSCNLYAPLSPPHRIVRLNHSIDTCKREIDINWTLYQGWQQIDSQLIMLSINHSTYALDTSLAGNINSLKINNIRLGDTLCYYVRSYTSNGSVITSSSNITCVETRELAKPSYLYLDNVTVHNESEIKLNWSFDETKDQETFNIEKLDASGSSIETLSENVVRQDLQYERIDNNVDVDNQSYNYIITSLNKCQEITVTSQNSGSIYLEINTTTSHNPYLNWDGGVEEYKIETRLASSSTWNQIGLSPNPIVQNMEDSINCYRIVADENLNSYGSEQQSYSNTVCLTPSFRYYVPTAINPESSNNSFVVLGSNIDHSKSRYQIVNRWGEILADLPTDQAWEANYKGKPVQAGLYIYILTVYGLEGEKETDKGTINVLR